MLASLMSCLGNEPPTTDGNRLYLYPDLSLKKIKPVEGLKIVHPEFQRPELFGKAGTILTILQADCPVCIQELRSWKEFLLRHNIPNHVKVSVVAIGGASEYFLYQIKKQELPFAVFLDEGHRFITENDIPEVIGEHTVLLDAGQRIVFMGSPVMNPNCITTFKQELSQLSTK